jgi:DNA-binding NarL/FixJ family response regulator
MTATILAVDDDRAFRCTLQELLKADPDFRLIGEAENGEQAVRSTRELHPDVVLMDIAMPRVDGLEAARRIKSCSPATKVVMLSVYSDINYQRSALANGADAFIAKKTLASELLPTLHHVVEKPAREGTQNQQAPVSVFIVDDDAAFLNFTADYLRAQRGIVVIGCARGGKEALAQTSSLNADVVLIDLEMPDMPGLQVITTLRRNFPRLGIIAFSYLDLTRYRKWALAAGADSCVPKSGLMSDLVPAILALADVLRKET